MFELSVAFKYLTPRWRQLSVSIISMISILVIALVVWLVVVFFSVTHGLENMWTDRLIALTAPVQITPTEAYYQSYYYKADGISSSSDYSVKNLHEKLVAERTDPYDPTTDEELPRGWLAPDKSENGEVKDLVKLAWGSIEEINNVPGLNSQDFEMTSANVKLRIIRELPNTKGRPQLTQAFISQAAYLGSFDGTTPSLGKAVAPLTMDDLTNTLRMISVSNDNIQEDSPEGIDHLDTSLLQKRLSRFFDLITITELTTPDYGWSLPRHFLPKNAHLEVVVISHGDVTKELIIPSRTETIPRLLQAYQNDHINASKGKLIITDEKAMVYQNGSEKPLLAHTTLLIPGRTPFPVSVSASALSDISSPDAIPFAATITLQGIVLHGEVLFSHLNIGKAHIDKRFVGTPQSLPFWVFQRAEPSGTISLNLPTDPETGEGILLPKQFREGGALVGDRGYLSYFTPTTSSVQEQRIPITVMGFYDPGILPIGGKLLLANRELTSLIRASHNPEDLTLSNGINVRFDNIKQANLVKEELQSKFADAGISKYWKIETFQEYDFTKDLLQQLRSERNIWSLIAGVIIIVACSNIISMLIILVNDKKTEIGILRSMGATSLSIAAIFGTCGVVMGLFGSMIGMVIALFTLRNLQSLVDLIGRMQGYEAFNPLFYGDNLPNAVSMEAVSFVLVATILTSLLAGIVPAVKASMLRPSTILRSE